MNKEIEKLLTQLAEECEKNELSMTTVITDKEVNIATAKVGRFALNAVGVSQLVDEIETELEQNNCDCEMHQALRALYDVEPVVTEKDVFNDFIKSVIKSFGGQKG